MMYGWDWSEDSLEYMTAAHASKRRKVTRNTRTTKISHENTPQASDSTVLISNPNPFEALLQTLNLTHDESEQLGSFEQFVEPLLPELIEASAATQVSQIKIDENGHQVIPLSRLQSRAVVEQMAPSQSVAHAMIRRRLILHPDALRASILTTGTRDLLSDNTVPTPLVPLRELPASTQVIEALYTISTTPYENSFLSRLQGFPDSDHERVLAVDWDNRPPWMDLMRDIRKHSIFLHPERELVVEVEAPIIYGTLQRHHLDQVHELLRHTFWAGIDVTDALQYNPEKCTVVVTYKRLVVGVALLSSPQETYITYLAVKSGWDNSQIATTMLYHLITLNPHKDITLHVSIKNPAMLLYNRFGFKAEEFIVGFYEDYLDSQSRASKNAFRLRLRQR